ncbi:MAG TPA: glycoside hydrolase family 76 protein [Solirubrobacteraceae bacterium]|nr:glycoside hydrolase family 76 protein [Solirubrobacteraceae bacterium]
MLRGTFDHIRRSRAAICALLAFACGCVLVVGTAHAAGARGGPSGRAGAARSPYPAGAERPLLTLTPAQLARARRGARVHALASPAAASSRSAAKKPKKRKKLVLHGDPARALVAFQAMQQHYYIAGSGLYDGEPFSFLWPFSQALAATISVANVPALAKMMAPELTARVVGLRFYLDTNNSGAPEGTYSSTLPAFDGTVVPPDGPGGPKYYDDNDWVGIELVRLYKLTHSASSLGSAEGIMAFEMSGWQSSPELACPGGIPFSNTIENTQRNTVTTGPAAELALQLYGVTRNPAYLQFAEMAYEWVRRCLLQPSGLYADHIDRQGVVEPTLWSYNQGTMIGAGTLLYKATGNSAYLYQARQTAKAALAYFTPQRLGEEIPFFPAVYFRNLLYLDSVTHDPPGPKIAQAYVDYAWRNLRLSNDVFVAGSPAGEQLLVQSAIVQIYALLSSSPSTYF